MKLKAKHIRLNSAERLYQYDKPIVALTGGIATGKSTVTKLLQQKGLTIIDADQLVKAIYATKESKDFIKQNYPAAWSHDEIDFKKLRELVFSDSNVKTNVEGYIYPRLPEAFKEATTKIKNQDFYIYDVPLLFERALETKVDLTILVYAPRKVQLARLIDRDGSKEEIGNKILDQQIDIEEKKERSDLVVDNSGSITELAAEVDKLLLQILE
jgi:dephospho-CoA kinase